MDPAWDSPMSVPPDAFEAHCAWLAHNRTVVDLGTALEKIERDGRLPRGTVALTFDDGFLSLYEHAWPILRRHRLPAAVFVVAETLTESGREVDWVDTPPPHRLATLDRDHLSEMAAAGIAFGSHSYAHHDLTSLDEDACVDDLERSRAILEDLLGHPVDTVAYPRGRHDATVRRAAERAGYRWGLALPEAGEPAGRFAVPRAGVYGDNGVGTLRIKTQPWYLGLRTSRLFPLLRTLAGRAAPAGPPG